MLTSRSPRCGLFFAGNQPSAIHAITSATIIALAAITSNIGSRADTLKYIQKNVI